MTEINLTKIVLQISGQTIIFFSNNQKFIVARSVQEHLRDYASCYFSTLFQDNLNFKSNHIFSLVQQHAQGKNKRRSKRERITDMAFCRPPTNSPSCFLQHYTNIKSIIRSKLYIILLIRIDKN